MAVNWTDLLKAEIESTYKASFGLLELVDEDTAAYNEVLSALKLPRDSEAQRSARQAAIRSAAQKATAVPMETLRSVTKLLAPAEAAAAMSPTPIKNGIIIVLGVIEAPTTAMGMLDMQQIEIRKNVTIMQK